MATTRQMLDEELEQLRDVFNDKLRDFVISAQALKDHLRSTATQLSRQVSIIEKDLLPPGILEE